MRRVAAAAGSRRLGRVATGVVLACRLTWDSTRLVAPDDFGVAFAVPPPPLALKHRDGRTLFHARDAGQSLTDMQAAVTALEVILPPNGDWLPVTDVTEKLKHHRQTIRRGWKTLERFVEHFPERFALDEARQRMRVVVKEAAAPAAPPAGAVPTPTPLRPGGPAARQPPPRPATEATRQQSNAEPSGAGPKPHEYRPRRR